MMKMFLAGSALTLVLAAGIPTAASAQVRYYYPPAYGYVMIPSWAVPLYRGRSSGRSYDPADSYAARGTEYDPYHPDPGIVTDAH